MAVGTILASTLFVYFILQAHSQEDIREPPRITEPVASREIFYDNGADVTLRCSARGNPDPVYEWYWNGAPLQTTPSGVVSFDILTGELIIKGLTQREEGLYQCRAKNTFPNDMSAVAISPTIEIRVARIEHWSKSADKTTTVDEGNYASIPCEDPLPLYYGPTTFKWFQTDISERLSEVAEDDRIYIDSKGTIHFAYVKTADDRDGWYYACAMSNAIEGKIRLGGRTKLDVIPGSLVEVRPSLQYASRSATFERNNNGRLECMFSGYVNAAGNEVPGISWEDDAGKTISDNEKYSIEDSGRVLVVRNLEESDEKQYTCIGSNKFDSVNGRLYLNVTSRPIWETALQSQTVIEGDDAVFTCKARSADREEPPAPPIWYKNGVRLVLGSQGIDFLDQMKTMVVKSVLKDRDIACFRCSVSNSVGTVNGDGCLNVILPIEIIEEPPKEQLIKKGDIVELTVAATSDRLYPVSYKWIFKNKTYEGPNAPPHVQYDALTLKAYINTTDLTDEEMREIKGLYRREVFHQIQTRVVDVMVTLENEPVVVPVAEAGFDFWIIILILGILIVIVVIIIICCVICRRKMQEGDYLVGRKETAAGLDPERELKDSGFHDLSRANYDLLPEKKQPNLDFDDIPMGDDESFGSAEYGDEATAFNEDGSFIGEYLKGKKGSGPPGYNSNVSNV